MDIISAISSSLAPAAIGIVRLSGEGCVNLIEPYFHGDSPKDHPRLMCYGNLVSEGRIIDEVMLVYLPGPKTFTREDMVEIYCHGGRIALRRVLELTLQAGARQALPGEFSERAILNGRIDLSQAEAMMELVHAEHDKAFENNLRHLGGDIRNEIKRLQEIMLKVISRLILSIDYPEEDEPEITYEELQKDLSEVLLGVQKLLCNSRQGELIERGLKVSIIGSPNVGKSSILNALLGFERAIVTEIEGTTRDTVEASLDLEGYPVRLIDTAGIRQTSDLVESLGVERSLKASEEADLRILVLSSDRPMTEDEQKLYEDLRETDLILLNKIDKENILSLEDPRVVRVSAHRKQGISKLKERLRSFVEDREVYLDTPVIANLRQLEELRNAETSLNNALQGISEELFYDYLEVDIKAAYEQLSRVLGESLSGDLMQEVFSRFCVGK